MVTKRAVTRPSTEANLVERKKAEKLLREIGRERQALKIMTTDDRIAGYFGEMHPLAAEALDLPFPHGPRTLVVVRGLSKEDRAWHIEHGRKEYELMRRGLSYRKAHAKVLVEMGDYKTQEGALRDSDRMIQIAKSVNVRGYTRRRKRRS